MPLKHIVFMILVRRAVFCKKASLPPSFLPSLHYLDPSRQQIKKMVETLKEEEDI